MLGHGGFNADRYLSCQATEATVSAFHYLFRSTTTSLTQAERISVNMASQNINANMFDRGIYGADTGSYENGGAQVVPLPLNLIALIISYVYPPNPCPALLWLTSSILLPA